MSVLPPASMSPHSPLDGHQDILSQVAYPEDRWSNFSTCVIESLCELFGADPSKEKLNLCDEMDLEGLDHSFRFYSRYDKCVTATIPLEDYSLSLCSCGYVTIWGDKLAHERGELELPDSMQSALQMEPTNDGRSFPPFE